LRIDLTSQWCHHCWQKGSIKESLLAGTPWKEKIYFTNTYCLLWLFRHGLSDVWIICAALYGLHNKRVVAYPCRIRLASMGKRKCAGPSTCLSLSTECHEISYCNMYINFIFSQSCVIKVSMAGIRK
jgi:hypothetical protein